MHICLKTHDYFDSEHTEEYIRKAMKEEAQNSSSASYFLFLFSVCNGLQMQKENKAAARGKFESFCTYQLCIHKDLSFVAKGNDCHVLHCK